jgi:oxygen-independent coproporphyrinogen-3 oxidase
MASWQRTVARAIGLGPDHLSLYLLELYPNAPLREAMARGVGDAALAQVSDDLAADMYLSGLEALDTAGYRQYEISNVARPGRASLHNLKYWQGSAWYGFGCGAHGTVGPVRWHNIAATADYIGRIERGDDVRLHETRTDASQMEEALFMGLRLAGGIDRGNFRTRFGVDPWSRHASGLAPDLAEGRVWAAGDCFGLTRSGMLLANDLLSRFV